MRRVAAALAVLGVLALLGLAGPGVPPAGAATSDACPSGLHTVDVAKVVEQAELSCVDLHGADLSGKSLIQVTLDHADLSGADLAHTDLTQASLIGADLEGADLSHADLTQADLTGADLRDARMPGADITQATTSGTHFQGVKGLRPYSTYVLVLAVVVFLALAGLGLLRVRRRRGVASSGTRSPVGRFGELALPDRRGLGSPVLLALAGALVVALGVQAAVGGLINQFSFAFDPMATVCLPATCHASLDLGIVGVVGGIFVVIGGLAVWSRA